MEMPEYPDIVVYLHALGERIVGRTLHHVRLGSPFLLRTVDPPLTAVSGEAIHAVRSVGKRIAFGLTNGNWLVIHLMIAGRLHWKAPGAKLAPKRDLAAFDFDSGTLTLTEAGSKRRASLHLLPDDEALAAMDPGGLEPLGLTVDSLADVLRRENHTLKRSLTDPRLLSGIGNAYSDEILHAARLSPIALSAKLSGADIQRLHWAIRETLLVWTERLRREAGERFPEKVTAFRPELAVHGKFGQPCPVCGCRVQRIRHAENETNYCPECQTGGRVLADRALSRLLRADWPKTVEAWELLHGNRRQI